MDLREVKLTSGALKAIESGDSDLTACLVFRPIYWHLVGGDTRSGPILAQTEQADIRMIPGCALGPGTYVISGRIVAEANLREPEASERGGNRRLSVDCGIMANVFAWFDEGDEWLSWIGDNYMNRWMAAIGDFRLHMRDDVLQAPYDVRIQRVLGVEQDWTSDAFCELTSLGNVRRPDLLRRLAAEEGVCADIEIAPACM
ncbi:MAG: hypothetical protein HND42_01625 [Armatimonadetes bacterium]|nr:hypothetical protein [Armatimonadota bacterium]NOG91931.1 hypothetical protein [Armatimonadota bacterium]